MLRGLVPVAIWLGTREYAGIWRIGSVSEHFRDVEVFGAIKDSKSSIAEVLAATTESPGPGEFPWPSQIATGTKPRGMDTPPGKQISLSDSTFMVLHHLPSRNVPCASQDSRARR